MTPTAQSAYYRKRILIKYASVTLLNNRIARLSCDCYNVLIISVPLPSCHQDNYNLHLRNHQNTNLLRVPESLRLSVGRLLL